MYTDRLRDARKRKGLSQQAIATALGIGASTVSGYETGIREPTIATLTGLMRLLDVDANYIFQDEVPTMGKDIELMSVYGSLSESNQMLLLMTARYLLDTQEIGEVIARAKAWESEK